MIAPWTHTVCPSVTPLSALICAVSKGLCAASHAEDWKNYHQVLTSVKSMSYNSTQNNDCSSRFLRSQGHMMYLWVKVTLEKSLD